MSTESVQDADGTWGTRTTLPPLPMVRKSTHTPMPEAVLGTLPSQAALRIAEEQAKAKRLARGRPD